MGSRKRRAIRFLGIGLPPPDQLLGSRKDLDRRRASRAVTLDSLTDDDWKVMFST